MKYCGACFISAILLILISSSRSYARPHSPAASVDPKAAAIWHKNERVFRRALNGHQRNDEFDQACLFFEHMTGVELHLNYFTLGTLPTAESGKDFARIQAWYKINKSRLYWDKSTRSVEVRPEAAKP